MPVWRRVDDKVKVGDRVDERYWVAEIKMAVPPRVKIHNHWVREVFPNQPADIQERTRRYWSAEELGELPEVEVPYARLVGAQTRLPL